MTIQTNEEIPAKKMGLLDAYATEDEIKKNTKLFLDPTKIDLSLKERIPTPYGLESFSYALGRTRKNRWRYYSD